jgi:large subunit ribosomal protein L10
MAKSRSVKEQELSTLLEDLDRAQTVVVFENPGFTFAEQDELRRKAREVGGKISVYKNTILGIAAKEKSYEGMEYTGTVICGFDFNDQIELLKVIYNKSKEKDAKKFKLVGGLFEGRVVGALDMENYASLPSKPEVLSKLSYLISYGATGIARTVNEVPTQLARALNSYREKLEKES